MHDWKVWRHVVCVSKGRWRAHSWLLLLAFQCILTQPSSVTFLLCISRAQSSHDCGSPEEETTLPSILAATCNQWLMGAGILIPQLVPPQVLTHSSAVPSTPECHCGHQLDTHPLWTPSPTPASSDRDKQFKPQSGFPEEAKLRQ